MNLLTVSISICKSSDAGERGSRYPGRGLSQSSLGSQGQSSALSSTSLGSSTGAANSLITLALLTGDVNTAQNLIKQQLTMGDIADVSSALAAAASNVCPEYLPSNEENQHSLPGGSFLYAEGKVGTNPITCTVTLLQGNSYTAAQALTNAVQNGAPSNAAAQAVSQVSLLPRIFMKMDQSPGTHVASCIQLMRMHAWQLYCIAPIKIGCHCCTPDKEPAGDRSDTIRNCRAAAASDTCDPCSNH